MSRFLDETGLAQVAGHVNKKASIFYGSQTEWDELTIEEKKAYDYTAFSDGGSQDLNCPHSFGHCCQKSLNFYQKTGLLFGDSIAAGAKAKVGEDFCSYTKSILMMASLTNMAVGSTRFTHGDTNPTIIDKIKSTTLDTDFIFIAGGVNDWQSQANLTDYETDLEGLMQYLKENYTGTVIFISPIPYVLEKISWDNGYKQATNKIEIIQYRYILEKLVLKYGYNLVCGEDFSFPSNLGERANVLIADGLHPTTYGHQLYAYELCAALHCARDIANTLTQSTVYRYSGKDYLDGRMLFVKALNTNGSGRLSSGTYTEVVGIADRYKSVVGYEGCLTTGTSMVPLTTADIKYEQSTDSITISNPPTGFETAWVSGTMYFTFDSTKIVDDSY